MNKRVKIIWQGKDEDAVKLKIMDSEENWNQYTLEDGAVIKIKLVAKTAYRLLNVTDPKGNPVYVLESSNVMGLEEIPKKE